MKRNRFAIRGRVAEHSFVALPHYLLKSPEFGQLNGFEVKLLLELAKEYKGNNNGDLSATFATLRRRGWASSSTLNKAIRGLIEKGWAVCTRHGGSHRCSLYGLTFWSLDDVDGKSMLGSEKKPRHSWKRRDGQS